MSDMRRRDCITLLGHAAAAPPSAASNSRRPMVTVMRPSRARCVNGRISRQGRVVLPFKAGRMPVCFDLCWRHCSGAAGSRSAARARAMARSRYSSRPRVDWPNLRAAAIARLAPRSWRGRFRLGRPNRKQPSEPQNHKIKRCIPQSLRWQVLNPRPREGRE